MRVRSSEVRSSSPASGPAGPTPTRVPLAWDLLRAADVELFLRPCHAPAGMAGAFPFPSRALRLPRNGGEPVDVDSARRAGLFAWNGPRESIVSGTVTALRGWSSEAGGSAPRTAAALLDRFDTPPLRLSFAHGPALDLAAGCVLMGIVNVTPDSFSDGGRYLDPERAATHALKLIDEGAKWIDVGGESTRPGAAPVEPSQETERVVPVIRALRSRRPGARISVDTRHASVASAALDAGADSINDVSGLADPEMAAVAAQAGCPLVLMHMRGAPETMQRQTEYQDLIGEIADSLAEKADRAREAGIEDAKIVLDPGIGFGKSFEGNEQILRQLGMFKSLGLPLLVGASRKKFLGRRAQVDTPDERIAASIAAHCAAVRAGANVLRVHDVRETREALAVTEAIDRAPER